MSFRVESPMNYILLSTESAVRVDSNKFNYSTNWSHLVILLHPLAIWINTNSGATVPAVMLTCKLVDSIKFQWVNWPPDSSLHYQCHLWTPFNVVIGRRTRSAGIVIAFITADKRHVAINCWYALGHLSYHKNGLCKDRSVLLAWLNHSTSQLCKFSVYRNVYMLRIFRVLLLYSPV